MTAEPFVIDAFGVHWELDLTQVTDEQAAELRHLWDRARVRDANQWRDVRRYTVVDPDLEPPQPPPAPEPLPPDATDDELVARAHAAPPTTLLHDKDDAAYAVSRGITLASIQRRAGTALMLHAAGLADPETGRAVALVAESGTGKTTASRLLGRRLAYLTDETVCVDEDFVISPYPKPLSIVVDPDSPHRKQEKSPDDLGLLRPHGPCELVALVLLKRHTEDIPPRLEEALLVEAMLDVLPQTSSQTLLERPLQRLAELCSRGGGPYRLHYRDIEPAAGVLLSLLNDTHQPPPVHWTGQVGTGTLPPGWRVSEDSDGTHLARAAFVDSVHSDHETLVLTKERPFQLSGLGSVLWDLLVAPMTRADVAEHIVTRLGPHEESESLIDHTIEVLLDSGLIHRVEVGEALEPDDPRAEPEASA